MDTLAKDFFVEDYIGDKEDVLRSIELLQMELDNFVNQHTDEDLQEAAPEVQNEVGYLLYTLGKSFYIIEDYATAAQYFETGLAFNLNTEDEFVIEMVKAYLYLTVVRGRKASFSRLYMTILVNMPIFA